jgi:hypothetical protein
MQIYGLVILSFMAGVIWGFATTATGDRPGCSTLVGIAADLGFHCFATGPTETALAGRFWRAFVALLPIDWTAARGPRAAMVDALRLC